MDQYYHLRRATGPGTMSRARLADCVINGSGRSRQKTYKEIYGVFGALNSDSMQHRQQLRLYDMTIQLVASVRRNLHVGVGSVSLLKPARGSMRGATYANVGASTIFLVV